MPQRMSRWGRDSGWLTIAWLLVLASADALAQPKPALTLNTNEPGLNRYVESKQVEQNATACLPATPPFASCVFEMLPVPAGKRLVVTYVSAQYYLSAGATFPEVLLSAAGSGFVMLPMQPVQAGTAVDRHLVATPVTFYVEPGAVPRFTLRGFDILDGRTASLSIVGYVVNLP